MASLKVFFFFIRWPFGNLIYSFGKTKPTIFPCTPKNRYLPTAVIQHLYLSVFISPDRNTKINNLNKTLIQIVMKQIDNGTIRRYIQAFLFCRFFIRLVINSECVTFPLVSSQTHLSISKCLKTSCHEFDDISKAIPRYLGPSCYYGIPQFQIGQLYKQDSNYPFPLHPKCAVFVCDRNLIANIFGAPQRGDLVLLEQLRMGTAFDLYWMPDNFGLVPHQSHAQKINTYIISSMWCLF